MKGTEFYYFAYGSNISRNTLSKYCPSAQKVCVAKLNDYRLDFQFWATIVPHTGKCVLGIVWKILYEDIPQLDRYEDVENNLYRVVQLNVQTETGHKLTCRSYIMTDQIPIVNLEDDINVNYLLDDKAKPATWYMTAIIDAAITHNIPSNYINQLKAVPTVECDFEE